MLRDIGDIMKRAVGPRTGFALLFSLPQGSAYLSNALRGDVVKCMQEWLAWTPSTGRHEKSDIVRLTLERRCADIGRNLARIATLRFALFLFDFGEVGNLAYFVSHDDMREHVAQWIDSSHGQA
jgi:hypothetical protein